MVLNYILVACPWSFQKHLIIHPKILDHGNCRNSTFWGAKSVKRFNGKEISKTVDCQLQSHWGETHEWIVQLFKNSLPRKTDFSVTLFLQTFDLYFNSVRSWSRAQCGGSITQAENINQGVLYVEEYRIDCANKFCVPGATKKIISEITNWRAIDWFKHKRRQTFDLTFVFRRFWFPQDQTSVFVYVCPARDRRFF